MIHSPGHRIRRYLKASRKRGLALGLAALALVFAIGELHANGSAWQTGVPSTGNPAASDLDKSTEVTIEEENLTIDLHQEFAEVEVRYRMRNTGGGTKQDFFFPIEVWDSDLKDYRITADDRPLKWEKIGGEPKKENLGGFGEHPSIRGWKKSIIPFSSGQSREVVIRYRARYARLSEAISDDGSIGDAMFNYSLSPAATWKGPIGKGKIVINILHPEPEDVVIDRPKERFAKLNATSYEWTFQNLKPTTADDIRIKAHQGYHSFPTSYAAGAAKEESSGNYIIRDDRAFLVHSDYVPKASSTLKPDGERRYEVENIRSRGEDKTWAEGVEGDGIGESVSMEIKRKLPLDAILIVPGYRPGARGSSYLDSRETNAKDHLWEWNNRVAQIEVTLNGEHTFTIAIPDEDLRDPYPLVVRGYSKPVGSVKLGVHGGSRFHDTCISLVELRAKLSKMPKMGPCR